MQECGICGGIVIVDSAGNLYCTQCGEILYREEIEESEN